MKKLEEPISENLETQRREELARALWIAKEVLTTKAKLNRLRIIEGGLFTLFSGGFIGSVTDVHQEPDIGGMASIITMMLSSMGLLAATAYRGAKKEVWIKELTDEIAKVLRPKPGASLQQTGEILDTTRGDLWYALKSLPMLWKRQGGPEPVPMPNRNAKSFADLDWRTYEYWVLVLDRIRSEITPPTARKR